MYSRRQTKLETICQIFYTSHDVTDKIAPNHHKSPTLHYVLIQAFAVFFGRPFVNLA